MINELFFEILPYVFLLDIADCTKPRIVQPLSDYNFSEMLGNKIYEYYPTIYFFVNHSILSVIRFAIHHESMRIFLEISNGLIRSPDLCGVFR